MIKHQIEKFKHEWDAATVEYNDKQGAQNQRKRLFQESANGVILPPAWNLSAREEIAQNLLKEYSSSKNASREAYRMAPYFLMFGLWDFASHRNILGIATLATLLIYPKYAMRRTRLLGEALPLAIEALESIDSDLVTPRLSIQINPNSLGSKPAGLKEFQRINPAFPRLRAITKKAIQIGSHLHF